MLKLRVLAPAALAALALTASIAAVSASAKEPEFHAESFPVSLQASGTLSATGGAGTINCKTTQSGSATSAATWWSVNVATSGCTVEGLPATVEWGECEIRYYSYSGLYIVCKGGKVKATIPSTGCVFEMGPQELLESIVFSSTGAGSTRAIVAKVNAGGVKFTQNAKCPGGAGTFNTGKVGGEVTMKGFTGAEKQEGIFIE